MEVGMGVDVFAELEGSPVEAAFLIRETGGILAHWARRPVRSEVVQVMGATFVASLQTLVEAFGCDTPRVVGVTTEHCHIVVRTVARNAILLLFAPRNVPRRRIEPIADRLANKVVALRPAQATRPR